MEKFSQFRDKGTGIAPFIPVSTPLSAFSILTHALLFLFRVPFFLTYTIAYFLIFQHLPLPPLFRKIVLWGLMAIPGIWWVDLQLDGVKRGTLADQPPDRFPHPSSVITANFTSPIDALYLAAIFDPIFTLSFPNERRVQKVGLLGVVAAALGPVRTTPPLGVDLVTVSELLESCPDRVILVLPECGTTNGKAILPFSPSLLYTPPDVRIFPVSLRYTPADVTTPIPKQYFKFLWNLLSQPTTCIRVRVAEGQYNNTAARTNSISADLQPKGEYEGITVEEQKVLSKIAEALARLGRVKRVGLTLEDKAAFVQALKSKSKGKKA